MHQVLYHVCHDDTVVGLCLERGGQAFVLQVEYAYFAVFWFGQRYGIWINIDTVDDALFVLTEVFAQHARATTDVQHQRAVWHFGNYFGQGLFLVSNNFPGVV